MKKNIKFSILTALCFVLSLSTRAQTTPIDAVTAGPHLLFELRGININNTNHTISFDLYVSASPTYVSYVATNGPDYGMQNVDLGFDLDLGTDGATSGVTVASVVKTSTNSSMITQSTGTASLSGASPVGYETRFKISVTRTSGTSAEFTTVPTNIASYTVTLNAASAIGTVANGAKIQFRNSTNGYTTGASGSKWSDFLGNTANTVGASARSAQPLPVTLLSFTAKKADNNRVQLNWETSMEQGTDYFDVERSSDGSTFDVSVRRMAAGGNSSSKLTYQTYDNEPDRGLNYYRLKMVDQGGKAIYSEIRTVTFNDVRSYTISPNPADGYVNVTGMDAGASVLLLSSTGQVLSETKAKSLTERISLDALASGIYYIQIVEGVDIVYTQKIVKK